MAQRSRGSFRRSWHLIWGTSLRRRSRPPPTVFSIPCVCRDLHREVFCGIARVFCPDGGGPQCGSPQWHHPHIQRSRADKTGRLPAGTPPGGEKKKEVAVSCWSLCVNPIITKPPLADHCPSKSVEPPEPPEACGYFVKVMMTLRVQPAQMGETTFYCRHTKPWLTIQRLVELCGYVLPIQVCGWAVKTGQEFH